mmetsp:Transcript_17838/g.28576  ORF Transcript_17838/g.28576 Transcript_17838/m.28576 type:complete len:347 (-) Transcript_17838:67-1107(-)
MKIAVRPLKGESFNVDISPEEKTEDLKQKIMNLKPEYPAELQKLIYNGKILADGSLIKEYELKEGDFIVIMVTKAKPPAASAAAAAPAAAAETPAAAPSLAPSAPVAAPAAPALAPVPEEAVVQLCDMGFARPDVERCLRAAFNNPERAVEYLMSGVPPEPAAPAPAAAAATAPPASGGGTATAFPAFAGGGGGGGGGGAAAEGPLAELRNHPRFAELAQVVAQNPSMLDQILQALSATNPDLVQTIRENPEDFLQMLEESVGGEGMDDEDDDPVSAMLDGAHAGHGHGGEGDAEMGEIELTEAEQVAVDRLVALGFPEEAALEAYLACDRNEELAVNYLLDSDMQ